MENQFQYESQLDFVKSSIPAWSHLTSNEVTFEKCAFGHSRITYKVTATDSNVSPNPIIFREFRDHSDAHLSRSKEAYVFEKLSSLGFAAKCYATKLNYRLEEYVGSRLIKSYEINYPIYRRKLAIKLAGIHLTEIDVIDKTTNFMISNMENENYLQRIRANCEVTDYNEEEAQIVADVKYCFTKEEQDFVRSIVANRKMVISHNDIWSGNILVNEKTQEPFYVDYEQFAYNFPGYDIGKLFFEPIFLRSETGPEFEVKPEYFPSQEDMVEFIRYYLVINRGGILDKEEENRLINDIELLGQYEKKLFESEAERDIEIKRLLEEAEVGMIAGSYWCIMIGMLLGRRSGPGMDFMKFAIANHDVYAKYKKLYLARKSEEKVISL